MDQFDKIILILHIVAGFTSLAIFTIPVVVKKGSKLHNLVGKYYSYTMWVVVVTAFVLSINNMIMEQYIIAAFLGFLSIITAVPLWYGIAAVKYKMKAPLSFLRKKRFLYQLVFFAGLGLFVFGLLTTVPNAKILMMIFGGLGLSNFKHAFKSIEKEQESYNWLNDHIEGMITTGIAAYTAFLVFGGGQMLGHMISGRFTIIFWVLPSIIGTLIIINMKKKFIKKPKTA